MVVIIVATQANFQSFSGKTGERWTNSREPPNFSDLFTNRPKTYQEPPLSFIPQRIGRQIGRRRVAEPSEACGPAGAAEMQTIQSLIPFTRRRDPSARHCDNPAHRTAYLGNADFFATLLAMAGHDLRQPLQLIMSAHDVLATMLCDEEQREELAHAAAATTRLTRMLGQLVEAVQLHEGAREDLRSPVLLRPVLEDLAAEFAEPARVKGISLRLASGRGVALSHPVLLAGMLRNLIRNAIDYTPAGGFVTIASCLRGSELRIDVRDTGIGIRASALSSIFHAFQRDDETRTDGLGLGLFIVKRATELLGHRIEVESVEGCGSRFTVVARTAQLRRVRGGSELEGKRVLLNLRRVNGFTERDEPTLRAANRET
jgi:two-component system phosphate regulon sensor histidine kinase PhoR